MYQNQPDSARQIQQPASVTETLQTSPSILSRSADDLLQISCNSRIRPDNGLTRPMNESLETDVVKKLLRSSDKHCRPIVHIANVAQARV